MMNVANKQTLNTEKISYSMDVYVEEVTGLCLPVCCSQYWCWQADELSMGALCCCRRQRGQSFSRKSAMWSKEKLQRSKWSVCQMWPFVDAAMGFGNVGTGNVMQWEGKGRRLSVNLEHLVHSHKNLHLVEWMIDGWQSICCSVSMSAVTYISWAAKYERCLMTLITQ